MAWLRTAPRAAQADAAPSRTRWQRILEGGGTPQLPEIKTAAYLTQYLLEVGPVSPGGLTGAPIDHAVLRAWQHNAGLVLAPWECSLLRRMSVAWANESAQALDPDHSAPWAGDEPDFDRDQLARRIGAALRGASTVPDQRKGKKKR